MGGTSLVLSEFGGVLEVVVGLGTIGTASTLIGDKIVEQNGWKEDDVWLRYSKGGEGFAYWGYIVGRNRQEVTRFSQKAIVVDEGKLRR